MRRAFISLLALAITSVVGLGCAQNAILELELTLPSPADVGGNNQVVIGFYSSAATEPSTLPRTLTNQQTLSLPPEGDGVQRVSVVASDGDVGTPLWLSVLYCDGDCDGGAEPMWIRYERAFYVGEFTQHRLTLPLGGDPPLEIGACEVLGCFGGSRPVQACDPRGVHLCGL